MLLCGDGAEFPNQHRLPIRSWNEVEETLNQ